MKHGLFYHDRRSFLRSIAVLAGGAMLAPTVRALPALAAANMQRVTEQRLMLGTIVGITALTDSSTRGEEAMGRTYVEVERLASILSRFDPQSALYCLNDTGRLSGAPQELLDVVRHGRELHSQSSGRFDVTIAPVVNLLERTHGKPSPAELREVLALVDANRMTLSGSNLAFAATGMGATLDGIAKGYIADCAAGVLKNSGIEHFMVDAGGDIRVQGSADGQGRPWRIAIEDPEKQGKYPDVITMNSGAVATSGGYEVFYDRNRKSTHLVNPDNGSSPQYVKSVSVQAPTVMQADGLATTLSLMHPREALELIKTMPGHACLLVTSSGAQLASPAWGRIG